MARTFNPLGHGTRVARVVRGRDFEELPWEQVIEEMRQNAD